MTVEMGCGKDNDRGILERVAGAEGEARVTRLGTSGRMQEAAPARRGTDEQETRAGRRCRT